MALYGQPEYQRAMQHALAKASMRGQPARTGALQTRLAVNDLARRQAFGQLGLQRKSADLAHRGRMASYEMERQALRDRKKQLPWQIGVGLGTALISAFEGKRRADVIKESNRLEQQRHEELMEQRALLPGRMWERVVWPLVKHRRDNLR